MITCSVEIRVRYSETDAMGVVYHANYLPWFEVARTEMLARIGLPYRQLEADGHLLPVLEASLRYLSPARYDDTLSVTARMDEEPRVRIRIQYEVRRADVLLATGHTIHAFMNRAGQAEKPPEAAREAFDHAFAAARAMPPQT
ncbi:MAG: acyl-CoA thioesterase [Puniceicoccales bacterium]|jgi:acyl-CoA thioester hydrolase|nr:acyl-CoA thioesterase [Puniceicoccales bacterium]